MSKISDEILMAYADGELADEETAALEAILSQDATLRLRLEPFVVTRRKLAETFDATLGEPIPEHLISTILRAPLPAGYAAPRRASTAGGWKHALETFTATLFPGGLSLATAASVALMVSVGAVGGWFAGQAGTQADPGPIAATSHGLTATGALLAALESTPSAVPATNGAAPNVATIVPVNTFRTKDSRLCREYRITDAAAGRPDHAGLACRTGEGAWRVAVHVETPKPTTADGGDTGATYRTATGPGIPAIDAVVDGMISGDVLGADEERELRENGWRRAEPPSR